MTKELITTDLNQLPSVQVGTDEDFESLSNATNFLQRLELKSKGVLVDMQVVKPGSYCVPKGNNEADDLGNKIDLLVLAKKPKAIDMSDKEAVIVSYERGSEVFADIEERSATSNSHCMYGATFLVFERSTRKFYEFFCGTASLRRVIGEVSAAMTVTQEQIDARGLKNVEPHGPITLNLTSKITKNKAGNTWFVPVITPSSNPIQMDQKEFAQAVKEITKFTTLDESGPEKVKEETSGRAR
jgi:hypothetical protein